MAGRNVLLLGVWRWARGAASGTDPYPRVFVSTATTTTTTTNMHSNWQSFIYPHDY